ncbi:MAG: hypothetical protein HYV92_11430 [Candidatus Rokubacteria bacterium]|nr:hypothetical protein [Candidatus Rokubacteria bacterium]
MRKPRTARDYQDGITAASRSGLAEVMTTLGAYRDALVLIGGWAPYLILEQFGAPGREFVHVGSIDIDLVVDPDLVDAERYATIVNLLLDRGYQRGPDPLFQFEKVIRSPRDGQDYLIRVDWRPGFQTEPRREYASRLPTSWPAWPSRGSRSRSATLRRMPTTSTPCAPTTKAAHPL